MKGTSPMYKILEDTDNLIEAILEVVLPDFITVTNLLKGIKVAPEDRLEKQALSQLTEELQYHDTLTQKMQHIMKIHTMIRQDLNETKPTNGEEITEINLIRLNHLQFQVACFEYITSMNYIRCNLAAGSLLHKYVGAYEPEIFKCGNIFLCASRKINQNFQRLASFLNKSPANIHLNLDCIIKIYSMESERSVIDAYIRKPLIDDQEIAKINHNKKHDIDLFN